MFVATSMIVTCRWVTASIWADVKMSMALLLHLFSERSNSPWFTFFNVMISSWFVRLTLLSSTLHLSWMFFSSFLNHVLNSNFLLLFLLLDLRALSLFPFESVFELLLSFQKQFLFAFKCCFRFHECTLRYTLVVTNSSDWGACLGFSFSSSITLLQSRDLLVFLGFRSLTGLFSLLYFKVRSALLGFRTSGRFYWLHFSSLRLLFIQLDTFLDLWFRLSVAALSSWFGFRLLLF